MGTAARVLFLIPAYMGEVAVGGDSSAGIIFNTRAAREGVRLREGKKIGASRKGSSEVYRHLREIT